MSDALCHVLISAAVILLVIFLCMGLILVGLAGVLALGWL